MANRTLEFINILVPLFGAITLAITKSKETAATVFGAQVMKRNQHDGVKVLGDTMIDKVLDFIEKRPILSVAIVYVSILVAGETKEERSKVIP